MTDAEDRTAAKKAAGEAAVEDVSDGDVVGLGSGSTAALAIRALGEAVDAGLDVVGVPTSYQSREVALAVGIPIADLDEGSVDVAIDGADQVVLDGGDGTATLVKGGGGAHAREKVVDASAERFVVVVDPSKERDVLDHPIPIAVLPAARTTVAEAVEGLGGDPVLRDAECKSGPVVTDDGNLVLDVDFGVVEDPTALAGELSVIPGVVEHGLFVDLADEIVVGRPDGSVERRHF